MWKNIRVAFAMMFALTVLSGCGIIARNNNVTIVIIEAVVVSTEWIPLQRVSVGYGVYETTGDFCYIVAQTEDDRQIEIRDDRSCDVVEIGEVQQVYQTTNEWSNGEIRFHYELVSRYAS